MDYYFITGTSRGIGKALAELLLKNENNIVYGFSRSNSIDAKNYIHKKFDLGNPDMVKDFEFPELKDAGSVTLVSNSAAGMEIKSLGKLSSENIIYVYNVNLVSPSIMMNNFIKKFQQLKCRRIILNISSGAAYKAIESWSVYCASKAALAMISEVTDVEQKLNHPDNPVYVFSVGPGVVNTEMQTKLRNVSPEDFSMVDKFIEYYEKKELAEPEDIAVKLHKLLQSPVNFDKVALTVREL